MQKGRFVERASVILNGVRGLLLPMPTTRPNFDRLARPYRWLEYLTFGSILQQTRVRYLPQLKNCCRALVLGDGDGRFTRALLRADARIAIHAVDISPRMLRALKRSARPYGSRLTTEAADLRDWEPGPDAAYDLIATHFFLDCLTTEEVATLAQRLAPDLCPNVDPNCLWLISDFAIPATPFGRFVAKPLINVLYQAFHLLTGLGVNRLPDHAGALKQSGWQLRSRHPRLGGLLVSELWAANPDPAQDSSEFHEFR